MLSSSAVVSPRWCSRFASLCMPVRRPKTSLNPLTGYRTSLGWVMCQRGAATPNCHYMADTYGSHHDRAKRGGQTVLHVGSGLGGLRPRSLSSSSFAAVCAVSKISAGSSDDESDVTDTASVMNDEEREFWRIQMLRVDDTPLKTLLPTLDMAHILGISSPRVNRADGKGTILVSGYAELCKFKRLHPRCVALVQRGAVYETAGFDALLLCQFAKASPTALKHGLARAEVPLAYMPRAVRALNEAGVSVAVCEEVPSGRFEKGKKRRTVRGVSTPARPMFLEGGLEVEFYAEGKSLAGIACSKGGYILYEYKHALRAIEISEQLTPESLISKLNSLRAATPLLLHNSLKDIRLVRASHVQITNMIKEYAREDVGIQYYRDEDPIRGFMNKVRMEMGLRPDEQFRVVNASKEKSGRPSPPYLSTVNNLGLNNLPGMPNLRDFVLPDKTPLESRRWLEALLRLPPAPQIALGLHQACRHLVTVDAPYSNLHASMSIKKVSDFILSRQGHELFFRELSGLLNNFLVLMRNPAMEPFVEGLMAFVQWDLQVELKRADVQRAVEEAVLEIARVVDMDGSGALGMDLADIGSDEDESSELARQRVRSKPGAGDGGQAVAMQGLVAVSEKFRGKVNVEMIKNEIAEVDRLRGEIEDELRPLLGRLLQESSAGTPIQQDMFKHRPSCKHYDDDRAIWITLVSPSKAHHLKADLNLRCPTDRKGSTVNSALSTQRLDDLLEQYRNATDAATNKVRAHLQQLCATMEPPLHALIMATQASIVGRALMEHVDQATSLNWCVPELETLEGGVPVGSPRLEVAGMWPYWKNPEVEPGTVRNNLVLDRIILLTGPNMAGKSTVLRSVAAIALLGCCGLMVPAQSASVPFYDGFMLRNFSGDSPLEGLSSFALEMVDSKAVLRDASPRSLVLLDEMGKGTEVLAATALSGAMLEKLGDRGSSVIFATHLHELVGLMKEREASGQVVNMCMEVKENSGPGEAGGLEEVAATRRIVFGTCFESLAFQVARDYGIAAGVVARAVKVHSILQARKHLMSRAAGDAAAGSAPELAKAEETAGSEDGVAQTYQTPDQSSDDGPDAAGLPLMEAASPIVEAAEVAVGFTIQDAAEILKGVMGRDFDFGEDAVPWPADSDPVVHIRAARMRWPPEHSLHSVVYIARYATGFLCGETDNIKAHRKHDSTQASRNSKHKGAELELAYVLMDSGAKSQARKVEAACILALRAEGFPLVSDADDGT